MGHTERTISKEVLEHIEKDGAFGDAGDKVLKVEIDYKKEAYRNRPRGYYLCLSVYLETATSTVHCLSFGDEGDPSSDFLIQETKAFSQKTFDALVVDPELLATRVEQIKAEYIRRRDLKKAKRADYDTRTRAQKDAAAYAYENPALVD